MANNPIRRRDDPMTELELEMWHARFAAASLERMMRHVAQHIRRDDETAASGKTDRRVGDIPERYRVKL